MERVPAEGVEQIHKGTTVASAQIPPDASIKLLSKQISPILPNGLVL